MLLNLPGELRNTILSMVLHHPYPVSQYMLANPSTATGGQPPLLRVSKRVREETLPIFYGANTFVWKRQGSEGPTLAFWLTRLGTPNLIKHIQHLRIETGLPSPDYPSPPAATTRRAAKAYNNPSLDAFLRQHTVPAAPRPPPPDYEVKIHFVLQGVHWWWEVQYPRDRHESRHGQTEMKRQWVFKLVKVALGERVAESCMLKMVEL